MKKPHPATIPRKPMKEIVVPDFKEDQKNNKLYIGRRTGKVMNDRVANGIDFLLKDNYENLLREQENNILDLYISGNDSDSSDEKEDSWAINSESEAEESEREGSEEEIRKSIQTNRKNEKFNKPRLSLEDNRNKNNETGKFEEINYKDDKFKGIQDRLMRDDPEPIYDINNIANNDLSENSSGMSSPEFASKKQVSKVENINMMNNNISSNLKNSNIKINATNNFMKSHQKNFISSELKKIKIEEDQNDNKRVSINNSDLDLSFDYSNYKKNDFDNNLKTNKVMNSSLSSIKGREEITSNLFTDNEEKNDSVRVENKEKNVKKISGNNPKKNNKDSVNKENELISKRDYKIRKRSYENEDNGDNEEKNEIESKKKKRKFSEMKENQVDEFEIKGFKRSKDGKKIPITESQFIKDNYNRMLESKAQYIPIKAINNKETFGLDGRYSMRIRIPRLNHLAGERISYSMRRDPILNTVVPFLAGVISTDKEIQSHFEIMNSKKRIKKKKRLVKGLKEIKEDSEQEYESLPENFEDEEDSSNEDVVRIFPHSQKGICRNLQVPLYGEIKQSIGKNIIQIDNKELKNLKIGDKFSIPPNVEFNFMNYSQDDLRIILRVGGK